MDTAIVKRHFERIGAQLEVDIRLVNRPLLRRQRQPSPNPVFELDVVENGRQNEFFQMRVREDMLEVIQLSTLNIRPDERHLLLMLKQPDEGTKEKFLCGHDERHWFVAAVDETVRHVAEAMESLKPREARWSQAARQVKAKNRNKRHNKGFVRQGEWFFIPEPNFAPPVPAMIMHYEPLQRPGSKPHIVAELYRTGGEQLFVSRRYPRGLSEARYLDLIHRRPQLANDNWQVMRRNPQVYVRGTIQHSDHATITLLFWHRVAMNQEAPSAQVAFLD